MQVVTCHGWWRSPSSGVGQSAVSISSGHRQSTTMASFTLLLLLTFPLLLLLLPPSPSGARTRLLFSRLDAPTMAFLPTPPSSTSPRSDDGILPTPPFYTRLPSTYSLRRSDSSPTRSGLPQKASSTPVPRTSPSTLGLDPLPFCPLPSPHLSPSPPHQPPVLASLPFPPPLPARASRVTLLSSSSQSSSRTMFCAMSFLT